MQLFPMRKFGHRLVERAQELLAHGLGLLNMSALQIYRITGHLAKLSPYSMALASYRPEAHILVQEFCSYALELCMDSDLK